MKKILFFAIVLLINITTFADSHKAIRMDASLENGNVYNDGFTPKITYGNSVVLDTARRVPGLTTFWDYWTNGNNPHKVVVLGDTVIVANEYIDSANASVSTGRKLYYQVSYNGGLTWLSDPLLVTTDGNAYPDLTPAIVAGSRTIVISGRQFNGGSRGFVAVDAVLGAGSLTSTIMPLPGSDYFSAALSSTQLGGVYQSGDSLFFRKFDFVANTYGTRMLLATPGVNIAASARKYFAASTNGQNAFAMWYDGTTGSVKMRGKQSTDGGTTFGSDITVMNTNYNAGGDFLDAWFGADVIYKPNTTTVCAAFNTQPSASATTGAAQGWKIVFWSPGINSGNPVVVADWKNTPVLSDTGFINNSANLIQVGMTGLSHPTLAYSSDGTRLYCVFSGIQRDTTSYGYFYNDLYSSFSSNDGANWSAPVKLGLSTSVGDEIYPILSKTGNTAGNFGLMYFLSGFPGSSSFSNTSTPRSKGWAMYTRIDPVTGGQLSIGIHQVSNEVPANFSLKQNYPNPFNPSTTIRFDIAKTSQVNLRIFDITGREVQNLIKGEMVQPGKYEVKFDGANLSSGLYFYKLDAGNISDVKKMILVK